LGKPQPATELFGQVLADGGLSRRDAGFFSARQAKALALSGEPDEAATVATKSVAVARETRSERTMNVVVDVVGRSPLGTTGRMCGSSVKP
jgi:hypothetical protein